MLELNGMIQEAENLLNLGHFEEAFERFMALETGAYEVSYLRPCQMALSNLLKQPQLNELFEALEKEVVRNNPHATFNYGCVKAHLKELGAARLLLMRANEMGISAAGELLRKI